MFAYGHGFGDKAFANAETAVSSGEPARMTEDPLSRTMGFHAIVVSTTTPQASRSIVAHEAVHPSQTWARPSAPSSHATVTRGGSPPRVEEVYEDRPLPSTDSACVLPIMTSRVTLPGEFPSGEFLLKGISSQASSAAPFPTDVSAGIEHTSAPTLLLGMRRTEQDEGAHEKTSNQNPVAPREYIEPSDDDPVGAPLKGVYEVETLLDMRETADGTREFLIKWKGWGPSWNNWEPEEHILDRRLLRKFNTKKKRLMEPASLENADDFTMHSKRRCAKQAAVQARVAARNEIEMNDDH